MAVLSFSNLKKTWYYLQKNGIRSAYLAALERILESRAQPYSYEALPGEVLCRQRNASVSDVRFSVVVPAFETKEEHLTALLDSLFEQTYPHWEVILADASETDCVKGGLTQWMTKHQNGVILHTEEKGRSDGKENPAADRKSAENAETPWQDRAVRYLKLIKNEGIAENTNAGIARASGDYIGLLDHDDLLTPDALYEFAEAVEKGKKSGERPEVLYSDEDKCDDTADVFYEPNRKMDFNQDLLLSNNYICHFLALEASLMKDLKLRRAFEGAQDYDLVLRAAGRKAHFCHVPKVLYHWRCHSGSTAANPKSKTYAYEAGRRAVEDFCRSEGWEATVSHLKHLGFYRVDYERDIFLQRKNVGAVAAPLPAKKELVSGIYEKDGSMRYEGLRKGFSGPLHRAALQQDVCCADLRGMRVRKELAPLYEEAAGSVKGRGEREIRQASMAFCKKLQEEGYLILWDPEGRN